ncbi:MAG: hypothetical protein Q7S77_01985 [Candidatus Staskawiczbacteria bacterium]|nr:hypothetical protein [Candidatus Staskawiczbacteria bacterium]
MKVLFQATNHSTFRSTLVGYLYEIAQKHRVILFTEEVDYFTKKILGDKNLFPGLEKIIFFSPPFRGDILRKNYQMNKMSKKLIKNYKPDIVITPEDIWPMSLYLLKFAKKNGILTLALQDGFRIAESKKLYLWSCLTNLHLRTPDFLPLYLRMFLVKLKKYLGHFLYYWILPLTVGQMPFFGKTSFVFWDISPGLRDADYSAVFSERDYDLSLKDGVKQKKLFILGHPLEHALTRNFFKKSYFFNNQYKEAGKIATIMWPGESLEFSAQDYSLISEKQVFQSRLKIVQLIVEKLSDWRIVIKPHPSVKDVASIEKLLDGISKNISVVEPSEPADKYIEMSKLIIGLPLPSTTLFTASLQHPSKIIMSLNLNQAFLGDAYEKFSGIEYIDEESEFARTLELIRDNKYNKKPSTSSNSRFSGINELLDYIYD